ncbi:DUF6894 family protein [Bradyrhizobium sp.]|uniref:DUF6894 family protein n=1 Tax=Bradyrhizobium sp. TaxID=376 RepID=UPI003C45C918
MARYFSDLDDGNTKYVDSVGTELPDIRMVPSEAIGFLTAIVKDVRDENDRALSVIVRDDNGRSIFVATLTLQSDWLETRHLAEARNTPSSLPHAIHRTQQSS